MNKKWKLILVVGLFLLVTGSVFLSACGSASQDESRIAKLESEVQANGDAIAKLQQQVDALTPPATVTATTPPASTVPTTPPVSVPPASTTNLTRLLASASVVLDNLTITPTETKIDQVVTMSIQVSNNSTIEGSYKVVFTEKMIFPQGASGVLEYADLITLKPGETKTVTFTATKSKVGTYSVEVGGKVGEYTVIE